MKFHKLFERLLGYKFLGRREKIVSVEIKMKKRQI